MRNKISEKKNDDSPIIMTLSNGLHENNNSTWTNNFITNNFQQNLPIQLIKQEKFCSKPFISRTSCSHTILNSPSSSCRLHVLSLNRQASHKSNANDELQAELLEQWSNRKCSISFPTTITEFSTLSSPNSSKESSLLNKNECGTDDQHRHHLDTISKTSSRTSISKSLMPQTFSSIDWLKFGFKILLMFTVLFWLFSIVTWMSIMPKTMPISLTIITSMMTIGLIISLVIQSEWPYSFEFMPNIEQNEHAEGDCDYDERDDKSYCMINNQHAKSMLYQENKQKIIYNQKKFHDNETKNNTKNSLENQFIQELSDSGLASSHSTSNATTVIQIDEDH